MNINYVIDPSGGNVHWLKRSEGNSIIEGIGIDRLTMNFKNAKLDGSVKINDKEALNMMKWLIINEGINVGPSASLNVVSVIKMINEEKKKGNNMKCVATILCDSGERYQNFLTDE